MRLALAAVFLLCTSCSLVVSDRTPAYEGACAEDENAINARYNREGEDEPGLDNRTVEAIALDCRGCAEPDCVEDCIVTGTGGDVPKECASCFADFADCAAAFCRTACLADIVENCGRCLCEHSCSQDLNECSGQPVKQCPE